MDEDPSGADDVGQELMLALGRLDTAHRRIREVYAASIGVSTLELIGLAYLLNEGPATPKLLARHIQLTTGATTAMIDRLMNAGMIERRPHPSDRRSVVVTLTESGAESTRTAVEGYLHTVVGAVGGDAQGMRDFAERINSVAAAVELVAEQSGH